MAGMGYMHSFGIVHRDMKLENVLLSGRLQDFHVAHLRDDAQFVIKPFIYIYMCVSIYIYMCLYIYIYMCLYLKSGNATLENRSFYLGNII